MCTMRQLGKELSSFSDAEVHGMYAAAAGALGQAPFRALQGITSHALPGFAKSWEYTLEPYAEIPDDEKSAYPAMVYARLAWYALNGRKGAVVVMNYKTGEIVCLDCAEKK